MILRNFVLLPISIAMLIWFIIPIGVNIFNVGNFVGIAFFSITSLVIIFWNRLYNLFQISKSFRAFSVVLMSIVAVLALIFIIVSAFMFAEIHNKPKNSGATVIVLGCKVKGERPTLMLEKRILAAYEYLLRSEDSFCIASGGQGQDEDISEALCIKNYLVNLGISPDRIFLEDKSTSTDENIKFSVEVAKKYGLPEDFSVVSNEFHLLRARIIAKEQGYQTTSVAAKTAWYLLPTYWVRDSLGVVYEIIF